MMRDIWGDIFRDMTGQTGRGTPGQRRDIEGVYIYDISPLSRRRVCGGLGCPATARAQLRQGRG